MDAPEDTQYAVLTGNQVVAHNLRMARLLRGWTQEEAAEKLEPYLGVRWSKASYSAAERSQEKESRIRNFSADELLAFSLAFKLPVTWFLLPPESFSPRRHLARGLGCARIVARLDQREMPRRIGRIVS